MERFIVLHIPARDGRALPTPITVNVSYIVGLRPDGDGAIVHIRDVSSFVVESYGQVEALMKNSGGAVICDE